MGFIFVTDWCFRRRYMRSFVTKDTRCWRRTGIL